MKQNMVNILFFLLIHNYATLHSADVSHKQEDLTKRLLFPLPDHNKNTLWGWVKEDYATYTRLGKLLGQDVQNRITQFLIKLSNKSVFDSSHNVFSRRLLYCHILLNHEKKEWKLPHGDILLLTDDARYYVNQFFQGADMLGVYDAKSKERNELFHVLAYDVSLQRDLILIHGKLDNEYRVFLYDMKTGQKHPFNEIALAQNRSLSGDQKHKKLQISPHGNWILIHDTVFNIAELSNIISCGKISHATCNTFSNQRDEIIIFNEDDSSVSLYALKDAVVSKIKTWYIAKSLEKLECSILNPDACSIFQNKESKVSTGFKIQRSDEDTIVWHTVFTRLKTHHKAILSLDEKEHASLFYFINWESKVLNIENVHGNIVFQQQSGHSFYADDGPMSSQDGLHIYGRSCQCAENSNKWSILLHVSKDEKNEVCLLAKSHIPFTVDSFNSKSTLMLHRNPWRSSADVFTIDDQKKLMAIPRRDKTHRIDFHPKGNALLCGNEKYLLYRYTAQKHLDSVAQNPLNFAQYNALQKICWQVEELKK